MADAFCGPSNPVQQFKQQTQLDRTLQQDRLTQRKAPIQGFRSHNPNAGVLDAEFEAFQAGVPLPELPQFHQTPPQFGGPSRAPSWAADFQRMQISPAPIIPQQHLPQPGPATASWAQGFRESIAQNAPRAQTSSHSPQAFQHMARYGMNGFQSNFAQPAFTSNIQSKGKEPVTEHFDAAAFDRAFDQAREDMLAGTDEMEVEVPAYGAGAATADFEVDHEAHVEKVQREAMAALRDHQRTLSQEREARISEEISRRELLERLGDEPLVEEAIGQEETEQAQQQQQDDDDALAATAKELLEKVEHNKSDKFKNSQFLNLMRKLRDREMKVEGDQMVETAAASTTTTETQWQETNIPEEMTATQRDHHLEGHVFENVSATGDAKIVFGDVYATGRPLEATHVDTRPPDYDISEQYQDHDAGRIDPKDGQAVVDYLNRKGASSPDDIDSEFMMTNAPPRIDKGTARHPWPGWATPSWASGYYYPKDMEPDWLSGLG